MTRKFLEGFFTPFPNTSISTEEIEDSKFIFNENLSIFGSIFSEYDFENRTEKITLKPPFEVHLDFYNGEELVAENYLMAILEVTEIDNFTEENQSDLESKMLNQIKENYGLTSLKVV